MAVPTQDVFEEHLGVIAALKDNFTRQDDAVTVATVHSLRDELAQTCQAREEDVKDVIRELSRRVGSAEESATYPQPEDAHTMRVAELEGSTAAARAGVEQLTAKLQSLQAQREEIKSALADLERKQNHLRNVLTGDVPHIRHKISLYATVTKVSWDFAARDRVAGIVNDPSCKFDLGTASEAATFEGVNKLWKLIDENVA